MFLSCLLIKVKAKDIATATANNAMNSFDFILLFYNGFKYLVEYINSKTTVIFFITFPRNNLIL